MDAGTSVTDRFNLAVAGTNGTQVVLYSTTLQRGLNFNNFLHIYWSNFYNQNVRSSVKNTSWVGSTLFCRIQIQHFSKKKTTMFVMRKKLNFKEKTSCLWISFFSNSNSNVRGIIVILTILKGKKSTNLKMYIKKWIIKNVFRTLCLINYTTFRMETTMRVPHTQNSWFEQHFYWPHYEKG